jgi:hypothetical protein
MDARETRRDYRKHPTQSTADPDHRDEAETAVRIRLVLSRADAIRRLGWRWRPQEPVTI